MAVTKEHNMEAIQKADAEEQALFFHHLRKRLDHDAILKDAREARKKDGNLAQADGIQLKHLDYAASVMQAEDKQKPVNDMRMHFKILAWQGLITDAQLDLLNDRMTLEEKARMKGKLAGLANLPRESGYQKNSKEDVAWLAGHDEGQKTFMANIEDALAGAEKNRTAGKTSAKGGKSAAAKAAPISDQTPDDEAAKAAAEKPKKPGKAEKAGDDGKTNAQREAERQAQAAFKH